MASFGPIAPYYDRLMHAVPYELWVSYYELLLVTQEKDPQRILDVCCGTGSITERLARRGYPHLAGIDLSPVMIEEARRKAADRGYDIRYEAMDAATFELGETFDAACSFFDSFNYITDLGQLGKAFVQVAKHLEPGGSFIFDLNTEYAFEKKMFDQQDTRKKTEVQYKWRGKYNRSTRVIHVDMEFWVGGEPFTEVHVQRAHSDHEIRDLLTKAGFTAIEVYDSYTMDPPRPESDRIHYACLKQES